ncbi:Na+/H+ antiporter NhaC [Escherichia coli]|uniref:Na+/H+ antiporter NhaC n=1 Tax=Escherichia coli 97.0246 TaxID=869670 RepID=A0A8E0FP70_ECOLX|nr:Na+/H+ antiporter NhaC [Escherichia coli]EFW7018368.1 Na+/H+ antiporter NhaC [Shigella sonnei]EEC9518901.1 Na+/H+ antiporter NhaC [Escherichia coli]EED0739321.1 Na+/H+ antiporter NhaC [Escherichia coli]EED0979388.1 Na+/H+ antiporter NhaC [Escherichia coli]EEQ2758562.1 Na+/H+ antiporter NhaC [Escherichia coli]
MTINQPSFSSAMIILAIIFILFLAGVGILNAPVEFVLIVVTLVTAFYARYYGARWRDIVNIFMSKIKEAVPAMLILLSIGILIGCWIVSGTIPLMVLYGLEMVSPHYLYLTAFLVTVCISLFTGTSWGTAGTIGVALMAVAAAMDVSLPITAGAVISGSYFGDKLSPLSDTTNMAAMAAGVELWQSIRNMMYTSIPAFFVSCFGFWWSGSGLNEMNQQIENIAIMRDVLQRLFWLNPLCLLPALLVFFGALKKWDTTVVLIASSFLALFIGAIFQPIAWMDMVQSAVNGFKDTMLLQFDGIASDPLVAKNLMVLLNRGGIYSMVSPIVVMLCAFLFASALEASGGLNIVLQRLVKKLRSVTSVVLATMFSSTLLVACTGNAVISFFLVKSMYDPCYDEHQLHKVNMSRAMESGATLLEGLFPWTISGMFMAKTLGVATLDYLPWTFFNLSCFAIALLFAFLAKWSRFGTRYAAPEVVRR